VLKQGKIDAATGAALWLAGLSPEEAERYLRRWHNEDVM